jgi:hypothetical protein
MQSFYVTPQDIEIIQKIIEENNINHAFKLVHESHGIGSVLNLEFDRDMHGREATISIMVSGPEEW